MQEKTRARALHTRGGQWDYGTFIGLTAEAVIIGRSDDIACDTLPLRNLAVVDTPSLPFMESFNLGGGELWVGGMLVSGPQVTATFDGTTLALGSGLVTFGDDVAQLSDDAFANAYGAVPRFLALRTSGQGVMDAISQYTAEQYQLEGAIYSQYRTGGVEAAVATAQASALVDDAIAHEGTIDVQYEGIAFVVKIDLSHDPATASDTRMSRGASAQALVNRIKSQFDEANRFGQDILIVISRTGGAGYFTGSVAAATRAQISQLKSGARDTTSVPRGPLPRSMASEFNATGKEISR